MAAYTCNICGQGFESDCNCDSIPDPLPSNNATPEGMKQLCEIVGVDFRELLAKVHNGLEGVNISHFTDGELEVIRAALDIAGGL